MKRILLPVFVAAALLALPQAASARVIELGAGAPAARSACPSNPCAVLARSTGYMGRSGTLRNPFQVGRAGRIVAFTLQLSRLQPNQVAFFNDSFGSPAQARISILRRGRTRRTRLTHRLLRQSRSFRVSRYLGSSPTFALDRPLKVSRGNIIALTSPTWVPAFAEGLSRTNWWRSSRRKGRCGARDVGQRAAQQFVGGLRVYGCRYLGARLLYTVTYIPDPRPTDGSDRRPRQR